MNIQTVAENLRNTIAGKQQMLEQYRDARFKATGTEDVALFVSIEFLRDNIAELKRILQDVEQCIPKPTNNKRDLMKGLWQA